MRCKLAKTHSVICNLLCIYEFKVSRTADQFDPLPGVIREQQRIVNGGWGGGHSE